jgi:hypothetical protein
MNTCSTILVAKGAVGLAQREVHRCRSFLIENVLYQS